MGHSRKYVNKYKKGVIVNLRTILTFSLLSCLSPALSVTAVHAKKLEQTIVAVVNDTAITSSDLNERIKLILLSSGLPSSAEMEKKIKPQILNSLIDEALQMNEANSLEIVVDKSAIEKGIDQIANQNRVTPDQFRKILKQKNVNIETLRKQVSSQIAWSNVVQVRIRPRINVSDTDIQARKDQMLSNIGKQEYLTAEIFLPFTQKDQRAKVIQLANRLTSQIREGKAPFSKVARQFSGKAGASKGGDLGWVQQGQLSEKLDKAVKTIGKGNVSNPIIGDNGIHILLVRDTRKITNKTIPNNEAIHNQIGMERLERQAKGYFIDIKTSAYIERRL